MKAKKDHLDKKTKVEGEETVHPAEDAADNENEKLKEVLAAKEKEASDNYGRYVRAVAELENYKKTGSTGQGRYD